MGRTIARSVSIVLETFKEICIFIYLFICLFFFFFFSV